MFKGSIPALIIPTQGNALDEAALEALIDMHLLQGSHGLAIGMDRSERERLQKQSWEKALQIIYDKVDHALPLLYQMADDNDLERIKEYPIDAILAFAQSEDSFISYFGSLLNNATHPVFIGLNAKESFEINAIKELAEHESFAGIVDMSKDLARPASLHAALGPGTTILGTHDTTAAAFLAQGGNGTISRTANIAPVLSAQLHNAWNIQDLSSFKMLRDLFYDLSSVISDHQSLHYAACKLGLINKKETAPLSKEKRESIERIMERLNLPHQNPALAA